MLPLPFVYPYAWFFWLAYALNYYQEILVLRPRLPKSGESRQQDRGSHGVLMGGLYLCAFIGFVGALNVWTADFPGGRAAWFWTGVVMLAAGMALRRHCFIMLGRHFRPVVMVEPRQPVIDRGAYRWIRHPSYLASILALTGMGLALTNWISLIALGVAPLAMIAYRIQVEEKALMETLASLIGIT